MSKGKVKQQNDAGLGHPEKNMYLLSFMDTTDRLDIILLEIRHLQQSIIDSLRSPTLYLALRYEEKYLFGGWVNDEKACYVDNIAKLSSKYMIRYPAPNTALNMHHNKDCRVARSNDDNNECDPIKIEKNNIEAIIAHRLGEIWSGDLWARGEKRNYYSLRALQLLKRQVFNDKLVLYKYAQNSGVVEDKKAKPNLCLPSFMIMKRGIMYRVNRYISVLRTHQQNFGKSLDFGLLRYPRPSIERRREIGIFNDYLSNRSRDVQHDLLHMLYQTVFETKGFFNKKSENQGFYNHYPSMIIHGWSQFLTVRSTQLWDDVSRELGEKHRDVSYVDSSIWAPDRPDLQPLITKEIVRSILRSHVGNLGEDYLANHENVLTNLYVSLSRVIVTFTEDIDVLAPIRNEKNLIKYIITDLLAVSVKGIPYLYALYLEIIGDGLEKQLKSDVGVRLDMVNDLNAGVSAYEGDYLWYFRLVLTAFWLERTFFDKATHVDKIVTKGVVNVCDELVDFLDHSAPKSRDVAGTLWKALVHQLKIELASSQLLENIKNWRFKKSIDTWDGSEQNRSVISKTRNHVKPRNHVKQWVSSKNNRIKGQGCSGKKEFHRSTMPLDVRIQKYLFRQILTQKLAHSYKCLDHKKNMDVVEEFKEKYQLEGRSVSIPYAKNQMRASWQPDSLLQNLHDIPYQVAILRSMDILDCSGSSHQWRSIVAQLHEDIILGRDLFSFALEFYTWRRDSPKDRLLTCINLIIFTLPILLKRIPLNQLPTQTACQELSPSTPERCDHDSVKVLSKRLLCEILLWMYADAEKEGDDEFVFTIGTDVINQEVKNIMSLISTSDHDALQKLCVKKKGEPVVSNGPVNKYGAVFIIAAFSQSAVSKDVSVSRRLEQLSGYKLKALLERLKNTLDDYIYDLDKVQKLRKEDLVLTDILLEYDALIKFLQIRDEKLCDQTASGYDSSEHYFYQRLLEAFGDDADKVVQYGHSTDSSEQAQHIAIDTLPREIKPVMVSRISMSSYYEVASTSCLHKSPVHQRYPSAISMPVGQTEKTKNAFGLLDVLYQGRWSSLFPSQISQLELEQSTGAKGAIFPHFKTSYLNTIGRYDIVAFTPTHLPCKCSIPSFREEYGYLKEQKTNNPIDELKPPDISQEKFISHFSRREVALPLVVYEPDAANRSGLSSIEFMPDDYGVMMVFSISLQRRSMRLNLLFRLLHAVAEWNKQNSGVAPKDAFAPESIEDHLQTMLSAKITLNDGSTRLLKDFIRIKALLTDGWGDLLLVFFYKKEVPEDNDEIFKYYNQILSSKAAFLDIFFKFQNAMYEDFMVDRTEMIYTPECLDAMVYRGEPKNEITNANYRFYFLIRFQEARKLERLIYLFQEMIKIKSSKGLPEWIDEVSVFDMPGAFDMRIYFKINYEKWSDEAEKQIQQKVKKGLENPDITSEEAKELKKKMLHTNMLYEALANWLGNIDEDDDNAWYWYSNILTVIDKIETGIERFVSYNGMSVPVLQANDKTEVTDGLSSDHKASIASAKAFLKQLSEKSI